MKSRGKLLKRGRLGLYTLYVRERKCDKSTVSKKNILKLLLNIEIASLCQKQIIKIGFMNFRIVRVNILPNFTWI